MTRIFHRIFHFKTTLVIHFCWDNFDLNEETPSSTGTTHSTHGIVIQEVNNNTNAMATELVTVPRDKKRTVNPNITELRPCFAKPKAGPNIDIECSKPEIDFRKVELDNFIWFICRNSGASFEIQTVPSWAGWVSWTAQTKDELCSQVEYMAPINFSINDNVTVQHIIIITSSKCTSWPAILHSYIWFGSSEKSIFACMAAAQVQKCDCKDGRLSHYLLDLWCPWKENERQWVVRNCYWGRCVREWFPWQNYVGENISIEHCVYIRLHLRPWKDCCLRNLNCLFKQAKN